MTDAELDRAIDAAARTMVCHDPSESFTREVLQRLESNTDGDVRHPVWALAALSAMAIFGFITWGTINEPAISRPRLQPAASKRPAPPLADALTPAPLAQPISLPIRASVASGVAASTPEVTVNQESTPTSPVPALRIDPLTIADIELPPLETAPAFIAQIQISDITIEPLTSSND